MDEYQSSLNHYERLKLEIEIDPYGDLHELVAKQSTINHAVGEGWANACNMRDKCEAKYKNTEAHVNMECRGTLEKPTEGKIEATVQCDPRFLTDRSAYLKWKHLTNLWYKLNESFNQRPDMIKLLCQLSLASHYSRESITKTEVEHQNVVAQQVRTAQAKAREPLTHSRDLGNAATTRRPSQARLSRG